MEETRTIKIAFLGMGIMGSRMSAHLVKAGYPVTVWNRTPDKCIPLVEAGATMSSTAANAVKGSDVVFTMLSTPDVVEEVALGTNGFLKHLPQNSVWADCSTVNPSFTRKMVQLATDAGIRFLDTPVAGSLKPAADGTLIFLAGGTENDVEPIAPLLALMGRKTVTCGAVSRGAAMKIVINMIMGQALLALTEGLHLGCAEGLPMELLLDTLLGGPVVAPVLSAKHDKILRRDYSPEFPLKWLQKDLRLAATTASEHELALPSGNVAKELYALVKEKGMGDLDITAIMELFHW